MKGNTEEILDALLLAIGLFITAIIAINIPKLASGIYYGLNPYSAIYTTLALNYMISEPGNFTAEIQIFRQPQKVTEFRIVSAIPPTGYDYTVEYGFGYGKNVVDQLIYALINTGYTLLSAVTWGSSSLLTRFLTSQLSRFGASAIARFFTNPSVVSFVERFIVNFVANFNMLNIEQYLAGVPPSIIIQNTPETAEQAAEFAIEFAILSFVDRAIMMALPGIGVAVAFVIDFAIYAENLISDLIQLQFNHYGYLMCGSLTTYYVYIPLQQIPIPYNQFFNLSGTCPEGTKNKICYSGTAYFVGGYIYKIGGYCNQSNGILYGRDLIIEKNENEWQIFFNMTYGIEK